MNGTGSRIALASSVGTMSAGQLVAQLGHATDVVMSLTMLAGALLSLGALVGEAVVLMRKRGQARACSACTEPREVES